jgi:hypothetical protein
MNLPCPLSFFAFEKPPVSLQHRPFCQIAAYIVLAALFCGMAAAQGISPTSDPRKELSDITSALQDGKIASIEILHMPDRVMTRASVTPENLEHWFESRVEISKIAEWGGRDDLLRALRGTKLVPASHMADMRSAIAFNGLDGKRIGILYVGRYFGRYIAQSGATDGAIGNTPVKLKGEWSAWLKQMIPSPLRRPTYESFRASLDRTSEGGRPHAGITYE